MKKLLLSVISFLLSFSFALASSMEEEIRAFARQEYPNDYRMQQYSYNKQVSAYNYLLTVKYPTIKEFAFREYPNDYAMQKYIYDKQVSAKQYMDEVLNREAKNKAIREYPHDYSMQKYIYDKFAY